MATGPRVATLTWRLSVDAAVVAVAGVRAVHGVLGHVPHGVLRHRQPRPALEPPAQPVLHLALRRARDRRELLHHAVAAVGALDGVGGSVDGAEAEPSISSCLSSRSWDSSYGSDICVLLMHFLPGCLGPAVLPHAAPPRNK